MPGDPFWKLSCSLGTQMPPPVQPNATPKSIFLVTFREHVFLMRILMPGGRKMRISGGAQYSLYIVNNGSERMLGIFNAKAYLGTKSSYFGVILGGFSEALGII